MAHSNSTTNYHLPQFVSTDKPAWLTDVNTAYSDIDTGMHAAQVAADSAQGDATTALTTASEAATAAAAADAKASGAVASIAPAFDTTATYNIDDLVVYNNLLYKCITPVINPGPWSGTANWERFLINEISSKLNSINGSVIPLSSTVADSIADKISDLGSYSATETAVGTWSDGSTLYKKCITASISAQANTPYALPHNINGLDKLIDIDVIIDFGGTVFVKLPSVSFSAQAFYPYNSVSLDGITSTSIGMTFGRDRTVTAYITMLYTKS